MSPCVRCGDPADHKHPEALSECYAGLEGWERITENIGKSYMPTWRFNGVRYYRPPDYLTDPALGMEMLEGLCSQGHVDITINDDGQHELCLLAFRIAGIPIYRGLGQDTQEALLRAAHAVAWAEWEQGP